MILVKRMRGVRLRLTMIMRGANDGWKKTVSASEEKTTRSNRITDRDLLQNKMCMVEAYKYDYTQQRQG